MVVSCAVLVVMLVSADPLTRPVSLPRSLHAAMANSANAVSTVLIDPSEKDVDTCLRFGRLSSRPGNARGVEPLTLPPLRVLMR
jgi:hypothetical protein